MKVLFLTIGSIDSLLKSSVHIDVINALKFRGHDVCVLCTRERRMGKKTECVVDNRVKIVHLKIGNITKCSLAEKGISTILIEHQFKKAIKKYYKNEKFDLVIYNTPPITFVSAIKYAKKKFSCKAYLMLKDIFPQNAVDLNLITTRGFKGFIYKLFREKEKKLYNISDKIGCMSAANIEYVLKHNKFIKEEKAELFPNAVFLNGVATAAPDKSILDKLGIDTNRLTFIYGGNLGKPQGLDFLARAVIEASRKEVNFVFIGNGTEKNKLYEKLKKVEHIYTFESLPSDQYEMLCNACDVGIVALDHRFTIPNYPSRILSYMKTSKPIFACTDKNTDVRQLVEDQAQCGKWCYSDDLDGFVKCVEWFVDNKDKLAKLGENGYNYMVRHFNVEDNVKKLENFVSGKE